MSFFERDPIPEPFPHTVFWRYSDYNFGAHTKGETWYKVLWSGKKVCTDKTLLEIKYKDTIMWVPESDVRIPK